MFPTVTFGGAFARLIGIVSSIRRPAARPMVLTHAPEEGWTGRLSTRVFHILFAGNDGQLEMTGCASPMGKRRAKNASRFIRAYGNAAPTVTRGHTIVPTLV